MFCGNGIGVISTPTNWISQPICNARHARGARRRAERPPAPPPSSTERAGKKKYSVAWRQVRWSSRARSASTEGGGRRSCVWCLWLMGFWWGPECCWTVGSESICQIWLQPCWVRGERKTNNRKHCGVRAEGGVGGKKKWWNVGVISVSERSGYYTACQRHLPSCLASFLSTPPPRRPSSAVIAVTGLSLNLSLFWLVCWPVFFFLSLSLRVARRCTKAQIGVLHSKKKKRKCQYHSSSCWERGSPFFFFFFSSQRSNWQDCGQDST